MTNHYKLLPSEYWRIPEHTLNALNRYAAHGEMGGHFLTAALENNLQEVFARADDQHVQCLNAIVKYIYNRMPSGCHGSREKVRDWNQHDGMKGLGFVQDLRFSNSWSRVKTVPA